MENMTRLKEKGESQWAVKGVSEVGAAIIASTLTFLALFLPFLFVPGLSALLFKELVLVVAGIVIVSLIVALTLTPVLTRALIKGDESGKMSAIAGMFDRIMNTLTQVYSRLLQVCLTHKWKTVLACVLVFSAGIFLAGKAGSEFLPKVDDGRVMVKLKMPSGTAVSEIDRILMQLEEKIQDLPEIESIFTLAGGKAGTAPKTHVPGRSPVGIQRSKRHGGSAGASRAGLG